MDTGKSHTGVFWMGKINKGKGTGSNPTNGLGNIYIVNIMHDDHQTKGQGSINTEEPQLPTT